MTEIMKAQKGWVARQTIDEQLSQNGAYFDEIDTILKKNLDGKVLVDEVLWQRLEAHRKTFPLLHADGVGRPDHNRWMAKILEWKEEFDSLMEELRNEQG